MSIIISIIIFGMVATGLFTFMGDLIEQYEDDGVEQVDETYLDIYNDLSLGGTDIENRTKTMYTNLEEGGSPGLLSYFIIAPLALWKVIVLTLKLPINIMVLINTLAIDVLPIPMWVLQGIEVIITAFVGFLILSAVLKWKL